MMFSDYLYRCPVCDHIARWNGMSSSHPSLACGKHVNQSGFRVLVPMLPISADAKEFERVAVASALALAKKT